MMMLRFQSWGRCLTIMVLELLWLFLRRADEPKKFPTETAAAWQSAATYAKELGLVSFAFQPDVALAKSLSSSCAGLGRADAAILAMCLRSYFTCDYIFHTHAFRNDVESFAADVEAQQLRRKR
eukprot:10333411-Lingulodinium_polyedra.AAC.1